MSEIVSYLMFHGDCEEALEYYKGVFGVEVRINRYAGTPLESQMPPEFRDKVMHGSLTEVDLAIMAADVPGESENSFGDGIHLCVNFASSEEQDNAFDGLSRGGNVTMPVTDKFWGSRFGMIRDKYGVNWMLNYESGQKS